MGKGRTILVFEGLKENVRKTPSVLTRTDGPVIKAFSTGKECIELHRKDKASLIIADIEMPGGMAGDELCKAVRASEELKHVSLLVICSKKKSEIEKCVASGANSFVTRPINSDEFVKEVEKLLDVPQRGSLRVLVRAEVKGTFKNEPFFCTMHNISATGVLIETDKVLAKADKIGLKFFLPDSPGLAADGEVVRVDKAVGGKNVFGIKFTDIDETTRREVEAFVARRRSEMRM